MYSMSLRSLFKILEKIASLEYDGPAQLILVQNQIYSFYEKKNVLHIYSVDVETVAEGV